MIRELDYKVHAVVEQYIAEECKKGDPKNTGLDERAISEFYYNYDCIVIPADRRRSLDYYGGFEYIDSDYITQYGEYVIYSAEADRVQEVLESIFDSFEEMADA